MSNKWTHDRDWHEDHARAAKAARLARVVERLLAEDDRITLDDLAGTDEQFRRRVAHVAKCRYPSERTWAVVLGIVSARMARAS